ncbi:UNVERIFIED_CONTAM: hypothetical protein FKN15_010452 [Acipenser sinensis]
MSLVPTSLQLSGSDWTSQEDLGIRGSYVSSDHAPLSPQSSVASSGSEQTEDQGMGRNTFQEEGSGMRAIVSQWYQEPKEKVVSLLLSHLPLLQPRNAEAKCEYMLLLQKVLTYTIESNLFVEESRQLLSYALIHPATTVEDRTTLAMWLNHLEEHLSSGYSGRASSSSFSSGYHPRQGSDEWTGGQSEIVDPGHVWQDKPATAGQNGHMPFHVSTSVPSAMNSIGSSTNTVLSSQIHPSPLKRSMSLVPTSLQVSGSDWTSQEDLGIRGSYVSSDHAPLSPQSSVASSGSEQTEDQGMGRNTFQEEGSGMRGSPGSSREQESQGSTEPLCGLELSFRRLHGTPGETWGFIQLP